MTSRPFRIMRRATATKIPNRFLFAVERRRLALSGSLDGSSAVTKSIHNRRGDKGPDKATDEKK